MVGGGLATGIPTSGSAEDGGAPVNGGATAGGVSASAGSSSGSLLPIPSGAKGASPSATGSASGSADANMGTTGSSGTQSGAARGGGGGATESSGPDPTMLPQVSGKCPTFQNGSTATVTTSAGSIEAQIWMGASGGQGGPLILYWHGTASSPQAEVPIAFDTSALEAAGGMIAGFVSSSRTGTPTGNTGDAVWYESDAAFADQVVACAIEQLGISPRRIHTAGYSAGGLQTVYMWYGRSGYIASAISYSGGDAVINKVAMEDPTNVAPVVAAHGAMGSDAFVIDFASASATWESDIKALGGFSIDCNDGGNHLDFFDKRAPGLKPAALQFFLDHPFKTKPEPYTSLPSAFPAYCHID